MAKKPKPQVEIVVCAGVEGRCLYVDDNRVAGPKPWGGGVAVERFHVDRARLLDALDEKGGG